MRIHWATVLCRLRLEAPERTDLALGCDDLLDRFWPERTDQFIFKVLAADVEPETLGTGLTRSRAHNACTCRAEKVTLFGKVVQTSQAQPKALNAEADGELMCVRRATNGQNDDGPGPEVQSNAAGQRLDRGLIAPTFDEHDRVCVGLRHDTLRVVEG